jgi:hypothetical protein
MVDVIVKAEAVYENLQSDDTDIEGNYTIRLKDEVPRELWASAALDIFHSNIPVAELDCFEFSVETVDGEPLLEEEDVKPYSLSNQGCVV